MIYKTIKNGRDRYITVEFGFDSLVGDYAEIYESDVPVLYTNPSLERLQHLGVEINDLKIVEVKLEEV